MTTWILIIVFNAHSSSMTIVQNLTSVNECNRVAKVIKEFDGRADKYKCVEVINK